MIRKKILEHPTTILIPTRNRQSQMAKQIPFLAKQFKGLDVDIRVLDGSTIDECAAANKKICAEHGIKYKHYNSDISVNERLYLGVSEVKTYTVSFLDDEDIISPSGFIEAVNFLHKHRDYSVAYGKYKCAYRGKNGRLGYFISYKTSKDITNESALERIWENVTNFSASGGIIHGVQIRDSFLSIYKELKEFSDNYFYSGDAGSGELLFESIALSFGKLKTLNCFYKGRVTDVADKYDRHDMNYTKLIMGKASPRMSNPKQTFIEIHTRNKNILKKYIHGVDEERLDEALDCIFASYFLFYPDFGKENERNFYRCINTDSDAHKN